MLRFAPVLLFFTSVNGKNGHEVIHIPLKVYKEFIS